MIKLTKTQKNILEIAANRPDGAIHPLPERIKGGATSKVIAALKKRDLITDATGAGDWRINDLGYQAIDVEPPAEEMPAEESNPVRKMRKGTKQARIITMLQRPEGATVEQIAKEVEWQSHTVRGFLAGVVKKKLGLNLTTQRNRIVGPNQVGSPGSSTTYRLAN